MTDTANRTFFVDVSVYDEVTPGGSAEITLSPEMVARIKTLRDAVVAVGADAIHEFNYTPEYIFGDDEDFRVDASTLVVTKDDCGWDAYLKHAALPTLVETGRIPLTLLDGLIGAPVDLREHTDQEE